LTSLGTSFSNIQYFIEAGASMPDIEQNLDAYVESIRGMADAIITNIIFIGQAPAPTFKEENRVKLFLDRLAEFMVDECTTDGYNNPIGIIRGTSRSKPPIFVVAHMDTAYPKDVDYNYTVKPNTITGAGLEDNVLGVGVLVSLPEILARMNLKFESDIVLAGVIQSIGKGNLRGIRHLLKSWPTPIRGAVCLESGDLGRLNYFSDGMIRCEIICHVHSSFGRIHRYPPNAILVLNEVINRILELKLPLKPRTQIIFGTISGGLKHGQIPKQAILGLEIRSDSDQMVASVYTEIRDIVRATAHEFEVGLQLKTISNVRAARLKYDHPLVKGASSILERLGIEPNIGPSESELSIFLYRNIPALTIGISNGQGYQKAEASMQIEPMFKGIAQIIGILKVIDSGVCDE
jgi:acetylornithine deacetylase/succinyl-diaminopimelate desuccinylase-like protein